MGTDLLDILKFEDLLMVVLGFTAVIFLPYLHIITNRKIRESTPRWMKWMIFGELAAGLLLMTGFTYFLVVGKVQDTVLGLITNSNERIDSNRVINMPIPRPLTEQDTADFTRWDPALGRWCMDGIIRLEANVTTHKDKDLELPPGTKLVKMFTDEGFASRGDAFIMVLSIDENPHTLAIICRGTNSNTEWLEDIEYDLTPAAFLGYTGDDYYKDVMLHTGFLKVYLNMRNGVMDLVKNYPVKPLNVVVAGHSSGAAVAAILSADLDKNAPDVDNIVAYIFGCPRVGNGAFSNYIDTMKNVVLHRVNNTSDIVPQFPIPIAPNLKKPENPFPYSHVGDIHDFKSNRHSFNANHYLSTYADWLDKAMKEANERIKDSVDNYKDGK